jgi:hypothetical protein
MKETAGPFSPRAVLGYWVVAALFSALIPFLLLLLYQHVPAARDILQIGQGKNVHVPILGWIGYRLRGEALWFTLATAVTFVGIGSMLCAWGAGLSYNKGIRIFFSEHLFLAAVAYMLIVVPLLSVSWAIALSRDAIPLGTWGEYGGNHGRWYRVYDLRYLLNLTFDMPTLGFISAVGSFFFRFSIRALLAAAGNISVFLVLLTTHYWLVD